MGLLAGLPLRKGSSRPPMPNWWRCYDPEPDANRDVAPTFGVRAAGSVDDLLAGDVDAVYIASPPAVPCRAGLACAQAGKHVLCEKPLGMTVAEAEQMIAACRPAGRAVGHGLHDAVPRPASSRAAADP